VAFAETPATPHESALSTIVLHDCFEGRFIGTQSCTMSDSGPFTYLLFEVYRNLASFRNRQEMPRWEFKRVLKLRQRVR